MASRGVVLFVAMLGGAAALATVKPTTTRAVCGVICVDSINECGERYGGCYDPCLESAPTAPPCPATYLTTWYPTPSPTPTTSSTAEETPDCSTITVCVDGINSCGIPFGAYVSPSFPPKPFKYIQRLQLWLLWKFGRAID
ncbi:hypothetical protein J3F83DRAFT_626857 [Trichoderma novae-zelandiae]